MPSQIVFLTLFLGLTSGLNSVALKATPEVTSIRIQLGGRTVATLVNPPWSAQVDFGPELTPAELIAIGYDAQGHEVARASQIINLPRSAAELQIVITTSDGSPAEAQLVGRDITNSPPAEWKLTVDDSEIPVGAYFRAKLPKLDSSRPHVVSAVMRFKDGQVARRDVVLQGGVGAAVSSELTPVLVKGTRREPESLDGCFSLAGLSLRAGPLEKTKALVVVVKDPDASEVIAKLQPVSVPRSTAWSEQRLLPNELQLDLDTTQQVMWPLSTAFGSAAEPTYALFPFSNEIPAGTAGMTWILTRATGAVGDESQPRRFADAVAVAAIGALQSGRRRAVVLLLSSKPDASHHTPVAVRRYLQQIGVPLFIWSLDGRRPDLAQSWGEVDDISTSAALARAVRKLNDTLRAQRIAWVATDALTSLRIQSDKRCGLEPVAHAPTK